MLTKGDLGKIDKLLGEKFNKQNKRLDEIDEKLSFNTVSVVKIENKIDAALELRQDVRESRQEVKDHEERITNLESI